MATKQHPKRNLTAKQMAFIDEYLYCINVVEAYLKAGYSADGKTATIAKNAYNLLNSESIQNELQERLKTVREDKEYLNVKLEKFFTQQIENDDIAMKDRLKAAELLAKMLGSFDNSVKLDASDMSFNFNIVDADGE